MLSEFAFTPAIFDEDAHDDKEAWCDQVRKLTFSMFPDTSAWPVVVSDLYAGSWSSHIEAYVNSIQDHRAKKFFIEFATRMKQRLVTRPYCGDWPNEDDAAWCREAIATHAVEPIDRIISVRKTKNSPGDDFSIVRCIDEVEDGGFWHDINADATPRMVIAEQARLLCKLCLHSEWVALINPYGFGNEQDFVIEVLALAMQRNAKFGKIHFELHANQPDESDPVELARKQHNVTNNMTYKIKPKLTAENTAELYFWPKLLDRVIVAGNYVKISGGAMRKKPRWGASMNHFARRDEPDAAPTNWNLLRHEALDRWFREFVAENVTRKPTPVIIAK